MADTRAGCAYNFGLLCSDQSACSKCGWNPAVKGERVRKILNKHPGYGPRTPAPCPFCGAAPRVTKLGDYVCIACNNKKCEMAGTGYCSNYKIALKKWNSRIFSSGSGGK